MSILDRFVVLSFKGPTDWKGEVRPDDPSFDPRLLVAQNSPIKLTKTGDDLVGDNTNDNVNDDINTDSNDANNVDDANIDADKLEPKFLFINCGGTFPWPVEKFMETIAYADKFHIYSIIPDFSYEVFYRVIPNHIFVRAECSTGPSLANVKRQDFGSEFTIETTVQQLSLADWIKANTREGDYVVLRVESEKEPELLDNLIQTEAIANVDKYYATLSADKGAFEGKISDHVQKFGYWSYADLVYSDVKKINPKQIPMVGRTLTECGSTENDNMFALILVSKHFSANAEHVLKLLNKFSPDLDLPVTIFLPHSFYKYHTLATETFKTFTMGLYISNDVIPRLNQSQESEIDETFWSKYRFNVLNAIICAQRELKRHKKILEHVLIEDQIDNAAIKDIQSEYNINFVRLGKDISTLISKVVAGESLVIEDTGRTAKEYLMIDIDVDNAEYLAVYILRRFRAWLLELVKCDRTS